MAYSLIDVKIVKCPYPVAFTDMASAVICCRHFHAVAYETHMPA
jgi:hypothetical protein